MSKANCIVCVAPCESDHDNGYALLESRVQAWLDDEDFKPPLCSIECERIYNRGISEKPYN